MPKELPRRVRKLAENLGIAPDQVRSVMTDNSRQAAIIVRDTLQRFIDNIQETSQSGSLFGYVAEIEEGDFEYIRLPKSGFSIQGQFKYLVTVKPSNHHESLDLNVFNVLDAGRPALPYRATKPYPLWGVPQNPNQKSNRILPTAVGGKIARATPVQISAVRYEPRTSPQTPEQGDNLRFTHGPIAATPAYHLYDRALKAAKDALAGSGFKQWNVIYVGPTPD